MNLLVLQSGALGDTILVTQFCSQLRSALGVRHVSLITRSGIAPWLKRHHWVDDAIHWDSAPLPIFGKPLENDRGKKGILDDYDGVISFLGDQHCDISIRLRELTGKPLYCIDPRPSQKTIANGVHITEQWRADLALQGFAGFPLSHRPASDPREHGHTKTGRLHARLGISSALRILLCHPGSGGLRKCCPLEFLTALMNQAREMQICPAWVIGPDEVERFGQEYAGNLRRSAPVLYEEDVVNAADLVADADVYFGNDAGMTHVAALAGVPTYTIFGPTDPRIWRPLGPRVRVVPFPSPRESTASWTGTLSAELRNLFGELRAGPTA